MSVHVCVCVCDECVCKVNSYDYGHCGQSHCHTATSVSPTPAGPSLPAGNQPRWRGPTQSPPFPEGTAQRGFMPQDSSCRCARPVWLDCSPASRPIPHVQSLRSPRLSLPRPQPPSASCTPQSDPNCHLPNLPQPSGRLPFYFKLAPRPRRAITRHQVPALHCALDAP